MSFVISRSSVVGKKPITSGLGSDELVGLMLWKVNWEKALVNKRVGVSPVSLYVV